MADLMTGQPSDTLLIPALANAAGEAGAHSQSGLDLLTVSESAAVAKVSTKTIQRLIKSGRLRATPYGTGSKRKNYRIRRMDLAAIADAGERGGEASVAAPIMLRPRRRQPAASSAADFLPRVR